MGVIFSGCFRTTEKHQGPQTGKQERFSTADELRCTQMEEGMGIWRRGLRALFISHSLSVLKSASLCPSGASAVKLLRFHLISPAPSSSAALPSSNTAPPTPAGARASTGHWTLTKHLTILWGSSAALAPSCNVVCFHFFKIVDLGLVGVITHRAVRAVGLSVRLRLFILPGIRHPCYRCLEAPESQQFLINRAAQSRYSKTPLELITVSSAISFFTSAAIFSGS